MYGRTLRIYDRLNSNSLTMYRENLPPGLYYIRIHADRIYLRKLLAE